MPSLLAESRELLVECSEDPTGIVLSIRTMDGFNVQTNGKQFVEKANPRSEAKWKAALDQLTTLDLLEDRGNNGEVFGITNAGYETADHLRQLGSPRAQSANSREDIRLSLSVEGMAPSQVLRLSSNCPIVVSHLEYMLSNETCIVAQDVLFHGEKLDVPLSHDAIRKVWNTPRSDQNNYDHSGPARIGVTVACDGKTRQYILPVQMESVFLNSTMYSRLVGSKTFYD